MSEETERSYRAYHDRPIGHETAKNRAEEEKILEEILEGTREPKTKFEKNYLEFVGGVSPKKDRPTKWVKCLRCGVEWKTTGFPSRTGGWYWATVCNSCADLMEATMRNKPTEEPLPEDRRSRRSPYSEG